MNLFYKAGISTTLLVLSIALIPVDALKWDSLLKLDTQSVLNVFLVPWRFWLWFMFWTLWEYSFHRTCHTPRVFGFKNPLWDLHRFHHSVSLAELTHKKNRWPKLHYLLFFFENLQESMEIYLGETIPALIVFFVDPQCGVPLLIFHYIYEIVATDALLEHNPDITNEEIVSTFAVGQFHLEHHRNPLVNFSFTITLWDHVFGTYKKPKAAVS